MKTKGKCNYSTWRRKKGHWKDRGRSRLSFEKEFQFSILLATGIQLLFTGGKKSFAYLHFRRFVRDPDSSGREYNSKKYSKKLVSIHQRLGLIVWAGSLLNRDYAYRENSDASRFKYRSFWLCWRIARVKTDVSFQIKQSDRPVLSTGEQ